MYIFQASRPKCCKYNNQVIYPGENLNDLESCGIVQCRQDPGNNGFEIVHEILFEDGCCNYNGQIIGEAQLHTDGGQTFLCFEGEVYNVNRFAGHQASSLPEQPLSAMDDIFNLVGVAPAQNPLMAALGQLGTATTANPLDDILSTLRQRSRKNKAASLDEMLKDFSASSATSSLSHFLNGGRYKRSIFDQDLVEFLQSL